MSNFQQFEAKRSFAKNIFVDKIILINADEYQFNLLVKIINFKKVTKIKNQEKKEQKEHKLKSLYALFEGRKRLLMLLKMEYFY